MEKSQNKQFICAMKCEGAKVYDQAGKCPKCNMKLVPVDEKSSTSHSGKCC